MENKFVALLIVILLSGTAVGVNTFGDDITIPGYFKGKINASYVEGYNNTVPPPVNVSLNLKANKTDIGEFTGGTLLDARLSTNVVLENQENYNVTLINSTIDMRNATVNDTGLVLDMRFNENSTGTATSTKIYDSSKYSNDGTWNGYATPNWTAGQYGSGLRFDGVNDYVSASSASFPTGNASISGFAWIYITNYQNSQIVFSYGACCGVGIFDLFVYTNGQLYLTNWGNIGASVPLNQWNFVGVTYEGNSTTATVWLNSNSYITIPGPTLNITNTEFRVGVRGDGSYYLNGSIDEVRIYNRALSADEVRALYYSNPLNEKSSFIQANNFRILNSTGNTTFNVSTQQTTVFSSIVPSEILANATLDIGAVGKSFNRVYAATFAGGEFADKAPGGYDYTHLWSWDYHSELKNASNISEGYNNWSTPNISTNLYYSAIKLNTTNGRWDLASGWNSIESVAIIPADNDLIVDGRLVILGGYRSKIFGNISIGDKLIVSNRPGVLTNARGLIISTLQYDTSFVWRNLPVSTDPKQYNKYDSAQGVAATVVAIALESYNSDSTGVIKVKVLNT